MKIEKGKPVILADGSELDPTKKIGIFDATGQAIPYVHSFDTETCEVEMMLKLKDEVESDGGSRKCCVVFGDDFKPFLAKFILPGAFVMTEDGTVIGKSH